MRLPSCLLPILALLLASPAVCIDCTTYTITQQNLIDNSCNLGAPNQPQPCCNYFCSNANDCTNTSIPFMKSKVNAYNVMVSCAEGGDGERVECDDLWESYNATLVAPPPGPPAGPPPGPSPGPSPGPTMTGKPRDDIKETCTNDKFCAAGPTRERADIDPALFASTDGAVSYLREYHSSGGIKDMWTMTFGVLEPRVAQDIDAFDSIPAVPVYVDLSLEIPTKLTEKTGTTEGRIYLEEYLRLDIAASIYGDNFEGDTCDCFFDGPLFLEETDPDICYCDLSGDDAWDSVVVFDNLKKRDALMTTREDLVNCGAGWCGDLLPGDSMMKRTSFFQAELKQSFQLSTFPFDSQEVWVNFTIIVPYGLVSMNSTRSVLPITAKSAGFSWTSVECFHKQHGDLWGGSCRFKGSRQFGPTMVNVVVPSMLFVFLAICSLTLSVEKSMPRVALTMFSLLVLTQLRTQTVNKLPSGEDFVWMDLFLFCCIVIVVLIMVSHTISERLSKLQMKNSQIAFDQSGYRFIPTLLIVLVVFVTFASNSVSSVVYAPIIGTILLAVLALWPIWYIRRYRRLEEQAKEKDPIENKFLKRMVTKWPRKVQSASSAARDNAGYIDVDPKSDPFKETNISAFAEHQQPIMADLDNVETIELGEKLPADQ